MADYGYSTPYRGISSYLPAGYMEAATAPGRNLAAGISALGQNIQGAIGQYLKNKAEDEFATAKIESYMAQYGGLAGQGPTPSGLTVDVENLSRIVGEKNLKKFTEGTATRAEKLAIANALETYGASELKNLQLESAVLQLGEARRQQQQRQMMDEAARRAVIPSTRTVDETISATFEQQGPPMIVGQKEVAQPAAMVPVPGSLIPAPSGGLVQAVVGGQPASPLESFIQQRGGPVRTEPILQPLPPVEVTETVKSVREIPYEQQAQQVRQYLVNQGAGAEVLGAVDQIMAAAGRQRPLRVTETVLPSGATVINAEGKLEILPPAKPVAEKQLTESQALSAGFAARMAYSNEAINRTIQSGYEPKTIAEFGWIPERLKSEKRKSYEAAKENWIAAQLRKESGAAIGPDEYKNADRQYFPQAGDSAKVIQQKAELRKVAERAMSTAAGENADYYIKQILGGAYETGGSRQSGKEWNPVSKEFN